MPRNSCACPHQAAGWATRKSRLGTRTSCSQTSLRIWVPPDPKRLGGSPVMIYLYVKDVDAVVAQAVAAGARLVHPVQDQFYGDRSGGLEDPFGHIWHVATHKEDVSPKELSRRAKAVMDNQGQK